MGMRFRLRSLLAIAAISTGAAFASGPTAIVPPTPDDGVRLVQDRKAAAYREVLAGFDAALLATPGDVTVGVARCRFINQFTDDEYGEWVESAPADFEACNESIERRWPREPLAQLFALEQLWGAEAATQGERLLKGADNWPAALRRELLTKLSEAYEDDNDERAGELAVMAAQLGEPSRAALAVKHLVARGKFDAATRLLRDTPPATQAWRAKARVEAALALPDREAALRELRRHAGFDIDVAVAARAHLRAGDIAAARDLLKHEESNRESLRQIRFDAALAANDFESAIALVDPTDMEGYPQNIARFVILATRAPSTLWSVPMLIVALICMLMLAVTALLPGALLLPVHYRGLIRQVRGRPAVPLFETIGLRRAWFAVAVVLCVPVVAGMLVAPEAMSVVLEGSELPEPMALFRMVLWGTFAALLCLTPGLRGMGMRHLVGDRSTLRASWRVVLAWTCLIGISVLINLWHGSSGENTETMQTRTIDALAQGGVQAYGPVMSLLLVAVLVPIFEELAFRGLLLGGLTRYVSFGWANTIQAVLFAVSHDDLPRFPFYLAMGLLAGWLVKRTQALGPAIALHMLNNALAFSLRLF